MSFKTIKTEVVECDNCKKRTGRPVPADWIEWRDREPGTSSFAVMKPKHNCGDCAQIGQEEGE